MRKHWSSGIPFIAFLCLFAFCFPLSAQDNLVEIFKKIEPSTVVIVTYDKDGKPLARGCRMFAKREVGVQNINSVTRYHFSRKYIVFR